MFQALMRGFQRYALVAHWLAHSPKTKTTSEEETTAQEKATTSEEETTSQEEKTRKVLEALITGQDEEEKPVQVQTWTQNFGRT